MATNGPSQPDYGWKGAATRPQQPTGQREWQRDAGTPGGTSGPLTRWRAKITLAGGAFLVLAGLIAYGIYILRQPQPPQPEFVGPGPTDGNNLSIPTNTAGPRGLEALAEIPGLGGPPLKPLEVVRGADWLPGSKQSFVKSWFSRGVGTVLVFVTAHGGADGKGAYLIPAGADLHDRKTLVRVPEVLDKLKELPDKTPKVLFLDVTQLPSHLPLGMLHNDFVREMRKLEAEIKNIPNLVVICSSSEGQQSWVSEAWGTTVFAHYVVEGFKGGADSDNNGRVTAEELFKYVEENVQRWVANNRDDVQQPILLGGEWAKKMELVAPREKYTPLGPPAKPGDLPKELNTAWKAFWKLENSHPSPAVVAPHLWRHYPEALRRYEQVLRYAPLRKEEEKEAGRLLEKLSALAEKIREAQSQSLAKELKSSQSTLALPAALGQLSSADEKKYQDFLTKWNIRATPEEKKKQVSKLPVLQANRAAWTLLARYLLGRAAEDPKNNLLKACDILRALDQGVDRARHPRPAEVQFMLLLGRDLPKEPDWKLVKKALEVRRLAEEAALGLKPGDKESDDLPAFSEEVFLWVQSKVDEADKWRWQGENGVIASEKTTWKDAYQRLGEAEKLYRQVQDDALRVRKALVVRAEVLAKLPYYSDWLARRPEVEDSKHEFHRLWRDLHPLWENLHALDRLLDRHDPSTLGDVAKRVGPAGQTFAGIRDGFDKHCKELRRLHVLQSRWHQTEDALRVPFIEPELRLQLLKNSRKIDHQLQTESGDRGRRALDAEKADERARAAAQRQGRMALAVLGKEWFDLLDQRRANYKQVGEWITRPDDPKEWWNSLTKAGDEVAHRWVSLSKVVRERTQKGREAPDLPRAAPDLRQAARWARHLDGAAVAWLGRDDPIQEYHRVQVHDLLCWQARRTYNDFLAEEDPDDPSKDSRTPYYRAAGRLYLSDARKQVEGGLREGQKARLQRVTGLEDKLAKGGGFEGTWTSHHRSGQVMHLTDESRITHTYRVERKGEVPPGAPVVWFTRGDYLRPDGLTHDGGRRALGGGKEESIDDLGYKIAAPAPVRRSPDKPSYVTEHVLHGRFRGHRFQVDTLIHVYRVPDVTAYQHRLPDTGSVAVRATEDLFRRHPAAVAFALDCSGSMGPPEGEKTGRIHKALGALKEVLDALPDGTRVSLRLFGLEGVKGQTMLVWKSQEWKKGKDADEKFNKLRAMAKPYGRTPLVRATCEAKGDFGDFKGPRMVVVITDGGDSEEKGEDVGRKLKATFKGSGISIAAIGFERKFGSKKEEENSEAFERAVRELGGKCYNAREAKELVARLREALLPRFRVEQESDGEFPITPGKAAQGGKDITVIGRGLAPVITPLRGLERGRYDLQVQARTGRTPLVQKIEVGGGDCLVIHLTSDKDGKLVLERALYGQLRGEYGRVVDQKEAGGWRLIGAQKQRFYNGDLQIMAITEETKTLRVAGHLKQIKPRLVWYEVKPEGGKRGARFHLRFGALAGFPAPAWGLDVEGWPRNAAPVLDAWVSEYDFKFPGGDHPYSRTLQRGGEEGFSLGMKPLRLKGNLKGGVPADVTLESVEVESRRVQTKPAKSGEPEKEEVSCLVVRLRYPRGQPFFVDVPNSAGHEHHFYHLKDADYGKYTGVFYDWTEDDLAEAGKLEVMNLISVEGFKAFCEREGKKEKGSQGSHFTLPLGAPDREGRPNPIE